MSKLFTIPDTMEPLWDENTAKYKCCCRLVHVKLVTLFIGYAQMVITMAFMILFAYYYVHVVNGNLPVDHWITQYGEKYLCKWSICNHIFECNCFSKSDVCNTHSTDHRHSDDTRRQDGTSRLTPTIHHTRDNRHLSRLSSTFPRLCQSSQNTARISLQRFL